MEWHAALALCDDMMTIGVPYNIHGNWGSARMYMNDMRPCSGLSCCRSWNGVYCSKPTGPSSSLPLDRVQHSKAPLYPPPLQHSTAPHWPLVSSRRQQLSLGWRSYFWGASQSDCLQLENPKVPHGLQNTRSLKSTWPLERTVPPRGMTNPFSYYNCR